jgi:Leucine-rich repeat (LRR) protein
MSNLLRRRLPFFILSSLEELQICSNNYSMIAVHGSFRHEQLKRLYISDNRLNQWKSICQLGWLFPQLETLLASDNPLESFRSNDDLQTCFPQLHTLSVDQVQIAHWDDIVALTKLPRLQALRIYSAPLLKVCSIRWIVVSDNGRLSYSSSRMPRMNDSFSCWATWKS